MLSPAEFERCLRSWIQALHEVTAGHVIAIDGTTLRGRFDKASNKAAIHMIRAWASANSIGLGQLVIDAKSTEIAAIPCRFLRIPDGAPKRPSTPQPKSAEKQDV